MTDIYTPEGALDYAAAAADLKTVRGLSSGPLADLTVNRIAAASLLDIAVSLNALVSTLHDGESAAHGERRTVDDPDDGEGERDEPGDDMVIDPQLDIGDRVSGQGPAEGLAGIIRALGTSEGEEWADVAADVDRGEPERIVRVFVSHLVAEPEAEPGDEPDARDLVERDLDGDFGDAQPVQCGATAVDEGIKYGPCIRKPGHKSPKHRDDAGSEWVDA